MILSVGMEPEAPGLVVPGCVDGPLEKVPPKPLADEFGHQAKLDQFDLALDPPVQLRKPSRHALDYQDVDFEPGVVQEGGEFCIRKLLAAGPVVISPHGVVQ